MKVVRARFRTAGQIHLFDAGEIPVRWRDKIVVEADKGVRLATAVSAPEDMEPEKPLNKVLRVATEKDLEQEKKNEEEERKAFDIALKKIENHRLNMKLVDAEFYLDRSKIIFYFTAEKRVDFRALVRDLAKTFRTRIELRQIGIRDEAKLIGGLGPCGLITCCSTWLEKFDSITVKMLRDQNILLNPVKYSGFCGRLMCCLAFEQEMYMKLKENYPPVGSRVKTPKGVGEVVLQDVINEKVVVKLSEEIEEKFSLKDVVLEE